MGPLLLFAVVLTAMLIIAIVSARHQRRRREALAQLAARLGLTFDPEERRGLDDLHPHFDCLQRGFDRYARNVIEGEHRGRPVTAFDYHYATRSTNSKGKTRTRHHWFTAALVQSDLPLKPLSIRREHVLDKVAAFFGSDDIDFESAEFSRRYHVRSPDRRWAYDVLHARAIQTLLDGPNCSIEFDQHWVLARAGTRLDAERFLDPADVVANLLDQLPEYVLRQQREFT